MQRSGFTLLEFLICCSILVVIAGFTLPFAGYWMQKNQLERLSAQIIQVINYSKSQSLLSGKPLRLIPFSGESNWDSGFKLVFDQDKRTVIYEWSWYFSSIHLTWHGFQSNYYLRFDQQASNQALNGYFSLQSGVHVLEKIIVNRLGDVRIENFNGAKHGSTKC